MKRRLAMIFAILLLSWGGVLAQTISVKGIVVSADDDVPIVGATVIVVGTSSGTVTDINGAFEFQAPASAQTLRVSYVGMQTQEVSIRPGTMSISLESDSETLSEVVVNGYGSIKKAAFTGAASIMDGTDITKKADANFLKSLEGTVTGLQMDNSTSMPGTWGAVFVRGLGSLSSGSQPLYVIDGMPVNSDYDGMSSSSNNYLDPMSTINPNDIESVTVLKDAAATAIYGSRASNGVIVITTKKGNEQGKFNINVEVKQGFSAVSNNNMKFANASETMDFFARGYVASGRADTYDEAYDYLKNTYFEWDGVSSYDWMDIISRKGYYQDYNLSAQGTSSDGKTNYYISGEYLNTKGSIVGADLKRYSGRFNIDSRFKWFTVGANTSVSYMDKNSFTESTGGAYRSPIVSSQSRWLPFWGPYNEDGTYNTYDQTYNPLAVVDKDLGDLDAVQNLTVNVNPYLKIDFGYGIWAKTSLGVNIMDQREYDYWSAIYNAQGMDYNGLGQQYNSRVSTITWSNTFGWDYTFNKVHNISLLLGQECQKTSYYYEYYSRSDFPFAGSGMRDMTLAGSDNDNEYYKSERTLASYFLDAHYDYANRYYASVSYRRDGSSVFGANHRWGNFWSFGLKWRLSEEKFLKGNNIVTNADVRLSYGTVGNQDIGYYAARGLYSGGYNYNDSPGMVPSSISNPELTWEKSKKFDVGFDLSFIHRVHLTFDFYNEVTSDALYEVPLSMTTGLASTYQNIGKIRNQGIELGVNANVFRNKDVSVDVFGTLTFNKNKVLKLASGEPIEGTYQIIEEGRPYHQFYMVEYAGVDHETGEALYYKNAEGDETTTEWSSCEKRYVGDADPKVYGGFGASATFYGVDLSLNFNYRLGSKVYNSAKNYVGWSTSFYTPLEEMVKNSWTEDNKNALYPQWIYGSTQANQHSSRWLMSGNYLRLSNITVGYTLPKKITKKALMEKVRFYMTFDNVYTWTAGDFFGYNPDSYANGVIAWQSPGTFTFTGGVQITF